MTSGGVQGVDALLCPNESTQITYDFMVPAEMSEPVYVCKLHLMDPTKKEKFGDAMSIVCALNLEPKKERHSEPV